MKANVGGIDKVARIGAGVVLIGLSLAGMIGPWGYLGVVPLATGLMGWCPAYTLFGIKTCSTK